MRCVSLLSLVSSFLFLAVSACDQSVTNLQPQFAVDCAKNPQAGPCRDDTGEGFQTTVIAASEHHACGLTPNGDAYCWGQNNLGQLGSGPTGATCSGFPCSRVPVAVAGGHKFMTVSSGENHTCALTESGQAFCWGYNGSGQLGNGSGGSGQFEGTPVAVQTGVTFTDISGEDHRTCGLDMDGHAWCWGNTSFSPVLVDAGLSFAEITSGLQTTCGRTSKGQIYCWDIQGVPVLDASGLRFKKFSSGSLHRCGVDRRGEASCWGKNELGQLGDGTTADAADPTQVLGGIRFSLIEAGGSHTCGTTRHGAIYCWGNNQLGQLGTTQQPEVCIGYPCSTTPLSVQTSEAFSAVSIGHRAQFTCAISLDGLAYCWGFNSMGQLGNGSTTKSFVPARVATP